MQQLSIQDASFIYLETPATPMHVGSLCVYDGSQTDPERMTEEALHRTVGERLHLNVTTRRRLVKVPFEADYPYWIEDRDFDLDYHLRRVALPSPGDRDALQQLASRIFARPMDMTRPLWELTVIEGLNNIPGLPANSFAVLTKTHHAAVDGASGLHFLELLHDLSPTPTPVPPAREAWHPEPVPTDAELLFRSGVNNFTQPFKFAQTLSRQFSQQLRALPSSRPAIGENSFNTPPTPIPKTRFNGAVTAHRVLGSISVSLADIKEIRQVVPGTTVNDVVLAVCGGALRSYLQAKNELDQTSLVAMAPVNLRSSDNTAKGTHAAAGNRVSALFVAIGTDIEEPLERLQYIHAETSKSKVMHQAVGASDMTNYSKFVPAFTAALASRLMTETAANAPAPPFNVSITNVPGPQEPLYFCGSPMVTAIGLGPITQGMGLIFPVLSYCGRVTISFTSCKEILPDPEFFEACLTQSFTTLLYSARLNSERTQFTEH